VSRVAPTAGAEFRKLCRRHDTAILAMHDIPCARACRPHCVMEEGRIMLDAPARTISAVDLIPYYGG
jgi:hypothetical protein